jgi:branched-chain amino acid transport system ATP-binding protein
MTALLEVEQVRVRYGGVVAVDDVSLSLSGRGITGLIGPNGAGKTTLIDALTWFAPTAAGRVLFEGRDVSRAGAHRRARLGLGRTFQSVELFDGLTVRENLLVAAHSPSVLVGLGRLFWPTRVEDAAAVDWALGVAGLEPLADRSVTELSAGQRKLVGVARALARRPRLLLLDEPASGLDTHESAKLGEQLRSIPQHGIALLLVDHDMSLVLSVCDWIFAMDFGRMIAEGTPGQIRGNQAVIDAYLGSRERKAAS